MTKKIVTGGLLAFVALSVVYLVLSETRGAPSSEDASSQVSEPAQRAGDGVGQKVIAYYFHRNKRCASCEKIEAWAKEIVEKDYASAVADGRLEWKLVNTDKPENEHFVQEYDLWTQTVVLVAFDNGKQTQWKRLDEVWELLEDPQGFSELVHNALDELLGSA